MVRRTSPPEPSAPLRVLSDPTHLATALSPLRRRLLAELEHEPDSAAGLSRRLVLPRQRLHYHLRELERTGFVELLEERQCRGCVERALRVTARAFVIDPALFGSHPADPSAIEDRFSSSYQLAALARGLRDLAELQRGAEKAKKTLPTLTLETEVRFANAEQRAAFAEELGAALAKLAAKYHDDAPTARAFRFVLAGHPVRKESAPPSPDASPLRQRSPRKDP
jgi:DNA-binding transcriptional ArsR family regulator